MVSVFTDFGLQLSTGWMFIRPSLWRFIPAAISKAQIRVEKKNEGNILK